MQKKGEEQPYLLDSYRIEKTLGEGTFGKVKLATHLPTQQHVAIKVLQKDKIVDQSDIERVTREICILKVLRHPNIVQLYEIIQTRTAIHLVMEYAPNGQLFDQIVKNKRIKEPLAASYLQQLLSGVEYIHRNGIVHRDLKPQNLLLDENNHIKIVDFGLSNQYRPGDRLKTACGSPCYAAPEMIAGKKYECMGVDIWSCGIILYAMLCGFLPFEDPNTSKLYKKIMTGQYETPKFLTQRSKIMLKSILNVDPATRYTLRQLRGTDWMKQTGSVYQADGLIVGRDAIEADQKVLAELGKLGMDSNQIKVYVSQNRHNQYTAYYELLKKKMAKQKSIVPQYKASPDIPVLNLSKFCNEAPSETIEKRPVSHNKEAVDWMQREDDTFLIGRGKEKAPTERKAVKSPVGYRPTGTTKKEHGQKISLKQPVHTPRSNDSFNASTIISSLVQANKNRIVGNKVKVGGQKGLDSFGRKQDFKLFPKRKISVTQDLNSSTQKAVNRSMEEGLDFKGSKASQATPRQSSQERSYLLEQTKTRKREQLEKQIKQITQKIDRQINSLKQQNHKVMHSLPLASPRPSHHNSVHASDSPNPCSRTSDAHQPNPRTERESIDSGCIPSTNSGFKSRQPRKSEEGQSNTDVSPIRLCPQQHKVTNSTQHTPPQEHSRQNISALYPKVCIGLFNASCLFSQPPQHILAQIKAFLMAKHCPFKELQPFSVCLGASHSIGVETIQGMIGYCVVTFTTNHTLNEELIHFLNR